MKLYTRWKVKKYEKVNNYMNYETVTPALQKVYVGWYDRSCCSRLGSLGTSFCCMFPKLNDKKSLAPQ